MNLTEIISKPKGHFKIELFNGKKLIDSFEENNLVMRHSRAFFMRILSGMFEDRKFINNLRMGTRGLYEETIAIADPVTGLPKRDSENNIITETRPIEPATPRDDKDGFNDQRTDLFCGTWQFYADNVGDDPNQGITYNILRFTPSGDVNTSRAITNKNDTGTVDILVKEGENPTLTYIFNIPTDAFNKPGGLPIKYSEAGLFADDTLIAMRTFYPKAKDETTSMRITWTITF